MELWEIATTNSFIRNSRGFLLSTLFIYLIYLLLLFSGPTIYMLCLSSVTHHFEWAVNWKKLEIKEIKKRVLWVQLQHFSSNKANNKLNNKLQTVVQINGHMYTSCTYFYNTHWPEKDKKLKLLRFQYFLCWNLSHLH